MRYVPLDLFLDGSPACKPASVLWPAWCCKAVFADQHYPRLCIASLFLLCRHIMSTRWNGGGIHWRFLLMISPSSIQSARVRRVTREGGIHAIQSGKNPSGCAPFDQPFHIVLNLAVGGQWPGNPNCYTTFPQTMFIQWIKAWSLWLLRMWKPYMRTPLSWFDSSHFHRANLLSHG